MANIFLVGPMGVGKTTIGKLLASELSYQFIDSDREIEKRAGADISWIFDVEGEPGFRARESSVIAELASKNNTVIATGGGAVLADSTRQLLKSTAFTVYLTAPLDVLLDRTSQDKTRPLLQVPNPKASFEKILRERDPLYKETADLELCSAKLSSKQIVAEIVNSLS